MQRRAEALIADRQSARFYNRLNDLHTRHMTSQIQPRLLVVCFVLSVLLDLSRHRNSRVFTAIKTPQEGHRASRPPHDYCGCITTELPVTT